MEKWRKPTNIFCISKLYTNMDVIKRKPFFILIFLASVLEIAQSGFNAVYLKPTKANYTCGSPPEEYFETQQGFLSAVDRVPYFCNASDPARAHPPENMADGSLGSHWQSKGGEDLAFITINFGQVFFAYGINITFGNYRRPGAIMVEKSTDFGATFTPWHYLVTSPASRQCSTKFGVQAFRGTIERVDQVLCLEYSRYVPPEYNETIFIELNQLQRGDGMPDPYTPGIQSWMNASAVRFSFSGLYRKFDSMATKWHHYTVREIAVTGRCDCKGHADGNHCPFNQSTGLRACQCQGNTCGVQCDQCCPLFNQFLWKPGSGAPWTNDPTVKCEPCNCHNHADACVFNQTVSDLGLSMSINGSMIGGGACVNCQHDTQGVNCEECKDYFYRPQGRNHSDANSCQACLCNLNGTTNTSELSFGDCVRDENVLSLHPGKQPGDCYCKDFVQGRQCDVCKPGFYRLTRENPQGCIDCNCHLNGTISRSSVCQGDYHGQCSCKTNIALRNCSQCKDGYYDLQDSDVNGCKFCNCDVGGTRSDQTCDKVTGVCHCQPHVTGRTCNRTESGFYYPDAHFIYAARSPYKSATYTLHVLLDIAKTGNYSLVIKFSNTENRQVPIHAIIQYQNVSASGPQPDEFFNFSLPLTNQCPDCQRKIATNNPKDYILLKKGVWMINITAAGPYQGLELDRVVAIPEEFVEVTVLGNPHSSRFNFLCSVEANDMSHSECPPWFFSITMDYLQGALACDCHPLGSNSSICESYGGQCSCKPGVEGRDCGRCKPGYYNLTASGCTPCGCNGNNKVCDVTTGRCECPENTVGQTCLPCQCNNNTDKCLRTGECLQCQFNTTGFSCEHCTDGHYGNALNQQCNACACSEDGSFDQQCDRVSGQCNCKTKVIGRNCSVCQVNTFRFGSAGCRDCECNTFGSANLQCSSGQCSCQANVQGPKCAQCTLGFYGLPVMPCRECNCSSVGAINGTVCTNDTTGQCQCKTGVTGRSCDQCMKYFTNFSDTGCVECALCIQKLRYTIVDTENNTNETKANLQALETFSQFNAPLEETSGLLQQAKVDRQQFYTRIAAGDQVYQELVTVNIPRANTSLNELSVRARNLSSFSEDAAANSTSILEDVRNAKNKSFLARQHVTLVDEIIDDIRTALNEHRAAASQAVIDSNEALNIAIGRNFTQDLSNISEKTQMIENVSANTEETLRRVYSQLFLARELRLSVRMKENNFTRIQESWNRTHAQFMEAVEQVYNQSREIHVILMETKSLLTDELRALNRTRSLLSDTNTSLINTQTVLKEGASVLEKYHHTVLAVGGDLEISMLRYDFEQTKFVLRVLKGRNLPSRDLPSQTSDPYVKVSIIPDWNNEGPQQTSTISGNVNPEFNFQLFRFTISMGQLNHTKVRLAVYDHDPGDEDDFLGVVFIDLSKAGDFINNVITNWYPLLPQDLSQLNSGDFVATSGLTDVSNLLDEEVGKIKQNLRNAAVNLQQAQNHASYLDSLAQQMELTFNHSRSHGALALLAIDRYFEIQEMVNKSLLLVEKANRTVNNITNMLSVVTLADQKRKADMVWQSFHELYNVSLLRNVSAYSLDNLIYEANTTFLGSVAVWNEVYEMFPIIQNKSVRYQAAASKAPDVIPYLVEAQSEVTNTSILLAELEAHLSLMERDIRALIEKAAFIRNTSSDGIALMNDASSNVQNITARLRPNPTEPPVNATVREAKVVMESLPSIRNQIEIHIDNTSSKLNRIRDLAASIPLALHIVNDSFITFTPSRQTIEDPFTNEISLDIKTHSGDGMLLYMVGDQNNLTLRRSGEVSNSLGLYISNSTVHAVFNLGHGPIAAHNPLELKNDTWYNVYFTRFEAEAFLTVSADINDRETVTVNGSSAGGNNMLQLTNQSVIYLGGLPNDLTEFREHKHFSGIIDNLAIDNTRYNLWNPKQVRGNGRLYAASRYQRVFYPANGKAASFHGNGYIQHVPGPFNSSLGYAAVEVDFRTLHQSGIVVAISNEQQRYHFVIYLHNGQVKFYFEPDQNDAITLPSTSSSYSNGRWYRVRAVRTPMNATLYVKPTGSVETADSRFVETGMTVMGSDHVITFGALNPNSLTSFEVTEAFSGDMNNLLLSGTTAGVFVPRNFNDPLLMIGKQGVSFGGVIRGAEFSVDEQNRSVCTLTRVDATFSVKTANAKCRVVMEHGRASKNSALDKITLIEYGTRFYGYREEVGECSYASVDVGSAQGALSSLTFTFKTEQESGVLLYSGNDGTPSLYLALLHGDLMLWSGDTKSTPVFSSSNNTFSDSSWHVLRLTLSGNGFSMDVNNTFLHSGTFNFAAPLVLTNPFYMGGVPRNMSSQVAYALCFKGGMKDLLINSRSVSFFSGHTLGVSKAGVIPARVPPVIPKTCKAFLPPPTSSNNAGTVHFGLLESKGQSYIGFNLTNKQSAIFIHAFVVGLDFRALSDDGLLLYATDNETHPTQFFSLELVRGILVYKFDSGKGLVSISTTNKYSGKGTRYRVYILRQFHFGAILVNTREYDNGRHDPPSNPMNLRKLYIGGIPNHVVAPHLTNRYLGFVGCIHDLNEENNMFDLTKLDMVGPDKSSGSCYSVAQPGLGFNGSSWARFDNFTLGANFSVQMTLRTSSRDGMLFLIMGNWTNEEGNRMYVSLVQSSGQLILTYNTTKNQSRVVWTEPGLGNNSTSSYLMCQMEWHTVRVTKQGPNITITLDEHHAVSGPVTHGATMKGELFLGGYPANRLVSHHAVSAGFKGCLKSFSLDGNSIHFARAADLSEVSTACPLSNSEKGSANSE